MEWLLEIALIGLLAATLLQALRLERALGVLKRDRAALDELVRGFNASTRQAEQGVERLRAAADGVGRQMAQRIDAARELKDDLAFLAERGERVADRLETLVRAGRALSPEPPRYSAPEAPRPAEPDPPEPPAAATGPHLHSQAERDLLRVLRRVR
jgi:hypothetical protein